MDVRSTVVSICRDSSAATIAGKDGFREARLACGRAWTRRLAKRDVTQRCQENLATMTATLFLRIHRTIQMM